MAQQSQESVVSVLVTDTTGVSFAEIRAGELHRLHAVPGEMRKAVGTTRRAVRHRRGLTLLSRVPERKVPVLNGPGDASAALPAPELPRQRNEVTVSGVTAGGTVLAFGDWNTDRLSPDLYALPWGADAWQHIEVPEDFALAHLAGSDGDIAHVVGGVGRAPAVLLADRRPALFAVDTARGTVTELPLPVAGPARRRWDRWRLSGIDPAVGKFEDAAYHDDVLVASASYGEYFEYEVLHAVDRARGTWSTVQLRNGECARAQYVDARRTAYTVTSFGNLWISQAGGPWQRTPLRKRLAEVTGVSTRGFAAGPAAFVDGRLLIDADGAVVACEPDGTRPRVLHWYDEDTDILAFVEPPAGTVGAA
ncbi:hypothetical protein [Streptomyces sp. NPDC051909]|uniref:hypothetical protein n=1 Tax=Streptomyces sp. NPDC051909 TaxID=3154944 RepID=UPI00341D2C51